jgi:PBP1b-binding outer membrane lipoprotein LpoB
MKTRVCALIILAIAMNACSGAKKAEAERKKTQQKMEELDQNKQQFEMKNPR